MQLWNLHDGKVPEATDMSLCVCTNCTPKWSDQVDVFFGKLCSLMQQMQNRGYKTPSPQGFVFGIKSPTSPDPQKVYFFRHSYSKGSEEGAIPFGTLVLETVMDS